VRDLGDLGHDLVGGLADQNGLETAVTGRRALLDGLPSRKNQMRGLRPLEDRAPATKSSLCEKRSAFKLDVIGVTMVANGVIRDTCGRRTGDLSPGKPAAGCATSVTP
jgi:hypothetical protein